MALSLAFPAGAQERYGRLRERGCRIEPGRMVAPGSQRRAFEATIVLPWDEPVTVSGTSVAEVVEASSDEAERRLEGRPRRSAGAAAGAPAVGGLVHVDLPVDATAPGRARRAVERLGPMRFRGSDAALLVSELVTLSLRHGGGDRRSIGMRLLRSPETVRVEVDDVGHPSAWDMPGIPTLSGPALIDRVADRWAVEGSEMTRAWAELHVGDW